ncbi:Outer membrane usher protein fimD precursor [Serratia grimesii]|nr:Outer membrane usher protein fimD precursor [Serratia grimesii]
MLFLYSRSVISVEKTESLFITFNFNIVDEVSLSKTQGGWPCFTESQLIKWGVLKKTASDINDIDYDKCLLPADLYLLDIKVNYNITSFQLDFEVVEKFDLNKSEFILPNSWEQGIPALLLDYKFNYRRKSDSRYQTHRDRYNLVFSTGLNYNAWRLRSQIINDADSNNKNSWRHGFIYLERDISIAKSRLIIGDNKSPDSMFDPFSYRGVSLFSDDRMLPYAEQPMLNWVQGVAKTNAIIRIRQNGDIIYQSLVSPGSFILTDIPLMNQDDYITMSIKEEDGSETEQIIPHSKLQNLAAEGSIKYSMTSGQFHSTHNKDVDSPAFLQSNITYGVLKNHSVYGGVILAKKFHNYIIGAGKSTNGWGEFTLDYRRSTSLSVEEQPAVKGDVYRVRYGKNVIPVNMNFNLEANYYPDNDYTSFEEHVNNQQVLPDDLWYGFSSVDRRHYNVQVQINLSPSPLDNIYFILERNSYRSHSEKDNSLILNYSKTLPYFDYTLSAQYVQYAQMKADVRLGINFSIPLKSLGLAKMRLQTEHNYENGEYINRVTLRGRALDESALSYSVSNTMPGNRQEDINGRLAYQYSAGEGQMTYRKGKEYSHYGLNITGAAILHANGLTLGQRLGDTNALIYAPDAPNAKINEQFNIKTDANGYAIVPNITPYQLNTLSVTPTNRAGSTHMEATHVPTQGAVAPFTLMP